MSDFEAIKMDGNDKNLVVSERYDCKFCEEGFAVYCGGGIGSVFDNPEGDAEIVLDGGQGSIRHGVVCYVDIRSKREIPVLLFCNDEQAQDLIAMEKGQLVVSSVRPLRVQVPSLEAKKIALGS